MKTLAKNKLTDLLEHWAERYQVLAPNRGPQGDCILDAFNEDGFTLDYGIYPMPPKSAFLPQSEVLFEVEKNEYREVVSAKKSLLFGLRSCDMMGILQSTSFMTHEQKDLYFKAKSSKTTTVVMACPGPQKETCFCTTTQSGPTALKGFDLQFYDEGDVFIIEVGSERGQEALSSFALPDMDNGLARKKIDAFRQESIKKIPIKDAIIIAMNRLRDDMADEKIWEYFGDKCIMCGGCVFVCPTCTCFNVYDQQSGPEKGLRARAWDACLLGGFTREASGHNPRPTQASRLKRRHEHKLRYYNKRDIQDGLCGCTGCGRCSDGCPVHIGVLEIAAALAE